MNQYSRGDEIIFSYSYVNMQRITVTLIVECFVLSTLSCLLLTNSERYGHFVGIVLAICAVFVLSVNVFKDPVMKWLLSTVGVCQVCQKITK